MKKQRMETGPRKEMEKTRRTRIEEKNE